jgi:tetratricopeptide (TPR) repeat protein
MEAFRRIFLTLACVAGSDAGAHAQHYDGQPLGTVHFQVSCSPPAQAEFDRALALLHHMTYPQARDAFGKAAALDPGCAMAQWGIAMTLFQPLWPTRPLLPDRQRGWEAVQRAKALGPATERERLWIGSAEAFFREPAAEDYWARIRRWAQALEKLHASWPQDPEIAAFYALSLLSLQPAAGITRANADRAAEVLLEVYRRNPDHPGAMHYLVHANDVPGRERELLDVTRKYEETAPHNPHALHMPTHIYTRLGDWDGVIRGNLKAAEAALDYPAGDRGQYVWDEFPHAIEYLVYAYLQKGDYGDAAAQLERLQRTANLEPTFKTAFHLASTRARYALERHDWESACRTPEREPAFLEWDRFPWPDAIASFAHGLGAARLGKLPDARQAETRLGTLEANAAGTGEELFARNIRILKLELGAWMAQADNRPEAAIELMQQAVELEESTPKHAVTPAPTIPAPELLGDLLMEQKKPGDALAAYSRSLALYPNRLNSLRGAAQARGAAP